MSEQEESESAAFSTLRALEGCEVRFKKGADKAQMVGGLVELAARFIHELAKEEEGQSISAKDSFEILAGMVKEADDGALAMMDHLWSAN